MELVRPYAVRPTPATSFMPKLRPLDTPILLKMSFILLLSISILFDRTQLRVVTIRKVKKIYKKQRKINMKKTLKTNG